MWRSLDLEIAIDVRAKAPRISPAPKGAGGADCHPGPSSGLRGKQSWVLKPECPKSWGLS